MSSKTSISREMKIIKASDHPYVRVIRKLLEANIDDEETLVLTDIIETVSLSYFPPPDDTVKEAIRDEVHRRACEAVRRLLSRGYFNRLPSQL
jgi:hypothetical protein